MTIWNPWHGCKKISPGCLHCYVYRRDESIGRDAGEVRLTKDYELPRRKDRAGNFKVRPEDGMVFTCMTSDFFLEEADPWRARCWEIMRERQDLSFTIITKRIQRFTDCIPADWGDGYPNVTVICTVENQEQAERRLPVFLSLPIHEKQIIHEPMLEAVDISGYLKDGQITQVTCGGESGPDARVCDYDWILNTRSQCMHSHVSFYFKQTGAVFRKSGRIYHIERQLQMSQAEKAGISICFEDGRNSENAAGEDPAAEWTAAGGGISIPRIHYEIEVVDPADTSALFERLARSKFRSSFHLGKTERAYLAEHGMDVIRQHAGDFVRDRLAPAEPHNDGKQTPMHGHPVFIAQHATGCCCRGCLYKWHRIPAGRALSAEEQTYIVNVLMQWIRKDYEEGSIRK